jgi:hypothetical protein
MYLCEKIPGKVDSNVNVMVKVIRNKENKEVLSTMCSTEKTLNMLQCPVFHEKLDFLGVDKTRMWNRYNYKINAKEK